jgi:hypothetical protein
VRSVPQERPPEAHGHQHDDCRQDHARDDQLPAQHGQQPPRTRPGAARDLRASDLGGQVVSCPGSTSCRGQGLLRRVAAARPGTVEAIYRAFRTNRIIQATFSSAYSAVPWIFARR